MGESELGAALPAVPSMPPCGRSLVVCEKNAFSVPVYPEAILPGILMAGRSGCVTLPTGSDRSIFATEQHDFQSRNVEQEKLNPYSPNRSTSPTEGASEWSIGIGYILGLAIHAISAISYLVWLNSPMHDLTPLQVGDGNLIGFAILFCAPIGAFLGALVADLTNRLRSARAGYLDNLNVSGTLAHSDEAERKLVGLNHPSLKDAKASRRETC